jgi:hypothetical protein
MKARVKETGEIGIVANIDLLFGCKGYRYQSDEVEIIDSYAEVDTDNDTDPDYWTRLEHTYAGMAMQGILSNANHALWDRENNAEGIAKSASAIAHALVEKLKEKE